MLGPVVKAAECLHNVTVSRAAHAEFSNNFQLVIDTREEGALPRSSHSRARKLVSLTCRDAFCGRSIFDD